MNKLSYLDENGTPKIDAADSEIALKSQTLAAAAAIR
jgi:hypothetical protein